MIIGVFIHTMSTDESTHQAIELFREHGGILRTGEALALGIHPRTLYAMRDAGALEKVDREYGAQNGQAG